MRRTDAVRRAYYNLCHPDQESTAFGNEGWDDRNLQSQLAYWANISVALTLKRARAWDEECRVWRSSQRFTTSIDSFVTQSWFFQCKLEFSETQTWFFSCKLEFSETQTWCFRCKLEFSETETWFFCRKLEFSETQTWFFWWKLAFSETQTWILRNANLNLQKRKLDFHKTQATQTWIPEKTSLISQNRGSPRGFREQGNIGKISKGTREHELIFREEGNKTLQVEGRKHC